MQHIRVKPNLKPKMYIAIIVTIGSNQKVIVSVIRIEIAICKWKKSVSKRTYHYSRSICAAAASQPRFSLSTFRKFSEAIQGSKRSKTFLTISSYIRHLSDEIHWTN